MDNMSQFLYEKINQEFGKRTIEDIEMPFYLEKNFSDNIKLRGYQKKAFQNFFCYFENSFDFKKFPFHLMFNMATGSGKTLMMAGFILYLYKKGYRNFLFFVDTTNIIDKTKSNFLKELNSSKFLFNKSIEIDSKKIEIEEVENFNDSNKNNINIKFTTISKLHGDLTNIKENSITFDDFENYKVVMLADEAHHFNASTSNQQTLTTKLEKPS
jgi:type III restriction enzyme